MEQNKLSGIVVGSAIEVHRHLGPGLLESAYESCLSHELELRGLNVKRQVYVPLNYKGKKLDAGYRLDLLIENLVVVEIKAVSYIEKIHKAQLLTYLKLTGLILGLILNFNVPILKNGICRMINS
jgi:GxxExxY protein